eukprot:CAMPEP_0184311666 /NCGR_PEP_ID=MMETSP1049-20130417/43803_1 /TAXON_ID=77928 /ORGANISM="Proteomonas sulcata, Strain CCMP704" /LENGTH=322 /DNA_ID=CAMNT_0026627225 /DNA_START=61 /DNA_END=1029 /DNA_ORIENTATION=-
MACPPIVCKFSFKDETRRIVLKGDETYQELLSKAFQRFNILDSSAVSVSQVDPEGETITLSSANEFEEALQLVQSREDPVLRFVLKSKPAKQDTDPFKLKGIEAPSTMNQRDDSKDASNPEEDCGPCRQKLAEDRSADTPLSTKPSCPRKPGKDFIAALEAANVPAEMINRAKAAMKEMEAPAAELKKVIVEVDQVLQGGKGKAPKHPKDTFHPEECLCQGCARRLRQEVRELRKKCQGFEKQTSSDVVGRNLCTDSEESELGDLGKDSSSMPSDEEQGNPRLLDSSAVLLSASATSSLVASEIISNDGEYRSRRTYTVDDV